MSAGPDHAPVPHGTPLAALMAARRVTRGAIRDHDAGANVTYLDAEQDGYARGLRHGKRDIAVKLDQILEQIERGIL